MPSCNMTYLLTNCPIPLALTPPDCGSFNSNRRIVRKNSFAVSRTDKLKKGTRLIRILQGISRRDKSRLEVTRKM